MSATYSLRSSRSRIIWIWKSNQSQFKYLVDLVFQFLMFAHELFIGICLTIIRYKCEARKPWPWRHSGWHPSPDSRPHCPPQSSHTGQKEVLLGNNNVINVGKYAKMQYVWILNDLLSPHAAGKGGKKRQTGTSAQSAPKKKITSTVFFSIANLMATLLPKATSNH